MSKMVDDFLTKDYGQGSFIGRSVIQQSELTFTVRTNINERQWKNIEKGLLKFKFDLQFEPNWVNGTILVMGYDDENSTKQARFLEEFRKYESQAR